MKMRTTLLVLGLAIVASSAAAQDERSERAPRFFGDEVLSFLDRAPRDGAIQLRNIPLRGGLIDTLHLEEFDVFAPDARIHVIDGESERIVERPAVRFFRGQVLGSPNSLVVLSRDERGLRGLIRVDGDVFRLDRDRSTGRQFTRLIDDEDLPEEVANWTCEADGHRVPASDGDRKLENLSMSVASSSPPMAPTALTSTSKRLLRLAVDTDYELTSMLGSTANVVSYVTDLVAAVSTLYETDLDTAIQVGSIYTYATSADPWSATTSSTQLDELGDYWNANRGGVGRSTVVQVSGKNTGGGVAWLGVLCRDSDFFFNGHWGGGYAVFGSVDGAVNADNPFAAGYWDVLAFAHELGHNADSEHTHCIPSSGYGRTFVDYCFSGETTGGGSPCYSGATSLPTEKGTIMSYCHLGVAGGYGNVVMQFGKAGEASEAVLPPMTAHIQSVTFGGSLSASATSVGASSTGNTATVNAAGATVFQWSITNGTITAGQGTSTVTFTAGASGQVGLQVNAVNSKGCGALVTGTIDITAVGSGVIDFNGDSNMDLVWRNGSSGSNAVWYMNGATKLAGLLLPTLSDTNWELKGVGDFNNDGSPDLVWRNTSNGQNAVWYMSGLSKTAGVYLPTLSDTNWDLVSVVDFDSDGDPDLVWRNKVNGQNAVWYMNGLAKQSGVYMPTLSDTNWEIEGTGDFNADGHIDLVWRNKVNGQNAVWYMNGLSKTSGVNTTTLSDLNWKLSAVGDMDGDNDPDLVWRNTSNGQNAIWFMNGITKVSGVYTTTLLDQNWTMGGPR